MAGSTQARTEAASRAQATFGGGCFWCLEAVFVRVRGVLDVQSGYAGGHVPDPTYRQVCTGTTGHAEVVQITYDPEQIRYEELLEIFLSIHDPTTLNRQGADVGPQYRSIILTHDATQQAIAERMIARLEAAGAYKDPIVTEIKPLEAFYPAEPAHHRFYERNRDDGYCRIVIDPKVAKLMTAFPERLAGAPLEG